MRVREDECTNHGVTANTYPHRKGNKKMRMGPFTLTLSKRDAELDEINYVLNTEAGVEAHGVQGVRALLQRLNAQLKANARGEAEYRRVIEHARALEGLVSRHAQTIHELNKASRESQAHITVPDQPAAIGNALWHENGMDLPVTRQNRIYDPNGMYVQSGLGDAQCPNCSGVLSVGNVTGLEGEFIECNHCDYRRTFIGKVKGDDGESETLGT